MSKWDFFRGFLIEDKRTMNGIRILFLTSMIMFSLALLFSLLLDKIYYIFHAAAFAAISGVMILTYTAYRDSVNNDIPLRDEMLAKIEGEAGYLTVMLVGLGALFASFLTMFISVGSMEYDREMLGATVTLMAVSVAIFLTYAISLLYRRRRPRK